MVRPRQTREEVLRQEKLENEKFDVIRQSKHSNLYVKNFDEQIFSSDQKLLEEFQCFGTIISVKL